jgi:hypothetical protein
MVYAIMAARAGAHVFIDKASVQQMLWRIFIVDRPNLFKHKRFITILLFRKK